MRTIPFFLAALLAFGFVTPLPKTTFQYQFKAGDEYQWTQNTKQKIKQSVMGMEQNTETLHESDYYFRVKELTSTGAVIEVAFTRLKSETKSPMGSTIMDSKGVAETTENKIFKAMVNKPFYLNVKGNGEIERIEKSDTLWSGFKDLGIEENQQKAIRESLELVMGESSLKSTFQQAMISYPDHALNPGDKWTVNQEVAMNFPMAIQNTWNLEAINSTSASLVSDGVFTTTDKDKTFNLPGGLKAKSNLTGQQASKTSVNVKTGWPEKQEVLSELKGTMTLLAGGMIPQDMEIPMEILSETTYVIKKK